MAHHGIHGNAPKLDPAFCVRRQLGPAVAGPWRQRPGRLTWLTTRGGAREVRLAHGLKRVKIRREFLDAIALVDLDATGGTA